MCRAAEQPEDRQAGLFAHQVPQSDVDDSDDPPRHSVEDLAAAECERIPVAVNLERVFADQRGFYDLFEIGAKNRFPARNDPIGARRFGPSFDAGVRLDSQQVLAHLERRERDSGNLHGFM